MKQKIEYLAGAGWLFGACVGYSAKRKFDGLVEARAKKMLADVVWEAEQICKDAAS